MVNAGGIVVCDRYYYSNIVYQGHDEASINRILGYNQQVMRHPPDVVFFLKAEPQVCLERLKLTRKDISIYENQSNLDILHKRYLALFSRLGGNIITIETSGKSEADVTALIRRFHL